MYSEEQRARVGQRMKEYWQRQKTSSKKKGVGWPHPIDVWNGCDDDDDSGGKVIKWLRPCVKNKILIKTLGIFFSLH